MNREFIKWMVGYAEGFEYSHDPDLIGYPDGCTSSIKHITTKDWEKIQYPLLLQRAIEGINKGDGYLILQDFSEIRIEHNTNDIIDEYFSFSDYDTLDEAKEQSLKYIWEQEK